MDRELNKYVHLSFFDEHPMSFRAKNEGTIEDVVQLKIRPEVILKPGVMFCTEVSNKRGSKIVPISDFSDTDVDEDILFMRLNWKDPAVLERKSVAVKYEILVPDLVEPDYILL
ncbi:hypothetical protein HJA_17557 [Hyphomonas jannaschiana VP2]|uniref:DarT domain-containing protein n=2 Tax=Hyphomonas jannaschiana TaxID=86 RepID=A0A059F5X8_9PROT|nr:hypothetical protein HJA_17557 [Hyphomonas jannaschiana VP2]